jgi:hypothetical protein
MKHYDYESFAGAIQYLLDEVNGSKGLDLEIDRAWGCPILDAKNISVAYKLRHKTGQPRTMSLAVDTFSGFDAGADGKTMLTSKAKAQIVEAIEQFWSRNSAETHTFIDVY